jgi:regulatory protein YycH of two-component signal transduction system YycFG
MKTILTAFVAIILTLEMIYPVGAVNTPNVDEIEQMLKRVENNMKMASNVVSAAKKQGEQLVENKVAEKAELKEAVATAENKIEAMTQINTMYATKMLESGIDTATVDNSLIFKGAIYDAFIEYQKNGGDVDFEYFRLYIYK